MLTYLGLPVNPLANIENEFNTRDIQKPANDTLNIYDVEGGQSLNKINLFGNTSIMGNYKSISGSTTNFSRTYPLLNISSNDIFAANNVSNASIPVPPIVSIPFWNPLRGDGKGFSIDLGYHPVRLKVFQDVNNASTNRFTISTSGIGTAGTPKQIIGTETINTSLGNWSTSGTRSSGNRWIADKSFTATKLGVIYGQSTGNSQMAIYNSSGVLLSKSEIKTSNLTGRQVYILNTPVNIVSGQTYLVIVNSLGGNTIAQGNFSSAFINILKTNPYDDTNVTNTGTVYSESLCIWVENDWTLPSLNENNSFNIWANGMVSIGQTLNTATYANQNSAGDLELNPNSLLVQNDINIGLSGAKGDSLARLHIKASQAEFDANRYLAFFAGGDGINAGAITRKGEYVVATAGGGFICLDAVNGAYYRIFVSGGTIQIQPFT